MIGMRTLPVFTVVGLLASIPLGATQGMARLCKVPPHLREMPSGEVAQNDLIEATRFMRHIWTVDASFDADYDGFIASVQHGTESPYGVWLHRVHNEAAAPEWDDMIQIHDDPKVVLDGIINADHSLEIVIGPARETEYHKAVVHRTLIHDPQADAWAAGDLHTIFESRAGRATITRELNSDDPRLWCAVTVDADSIVQIKALYSTDQGVTWNDSGQHFGSANSVHEKSGKILAFADRIGLVFHDDDAVSTRSKWLAYRSNCDDPLAPWTTALIDTMTTPYGHKPWSHSHWSVAAGSDGRLHLVFQDKNSGITDSGVRYAIADGSATPIEWLVLPMGSQVDEFPNNLGMYPQVSVGSDNTPYVFMDSGKRANATACVNGLWKPFQEVAGPPERVCGNTRLTTPERFCTILPFAYQIYDCDNGTTGLDYGIARGCCQTCCD